MAVTAVDILKVLERSARYAQRRAGRTRVINIALDSRRGRQALRARGSQRRGLVVTSDVVQVDLGRSWEEPVVNEMLRLVKLGFERPRGRASDATRARHGGRRGGEGRGKFWDRTGTLIDGIDKQQTSTGWAITFPTGRLTEGYVLSRAKKANRYLDARALWKKVSPTVKRKAARRAKRKRGPLKIAGLERYPGE